MIFVPHVTGPSIPTRIALIGYDYTAVYVGADDDAYRRYFQERWAAKTTFVNIEHDVVPWPGAIESLLECAESWCAFNYHLPCHRQAGIGTTGPIGCVKFGTDFIVETAGMWDEPVDWHRCDIHLRDWTVPRVHVHEHSPGVVHANPLLLG